MEEARKLNWVSEDPASGKLLPVLCAPDHENPMPDDAFSGPGWPFLETSGKKRDLGSIAVITPVDPRHKRHVDRCAEVVSRAWAYSPGPFSSRTHIFAHDEERKGPGWGRNEGMARAPDADWYYFLDCDDLAKRYVFEAMNWADRETDAVWGMIEERIHDDRTHSYGMSVNPRSYNEVTWNRFMSLGHDGGAGLNSAMIVRGDFARKFKWFEGAYVYEDIEMFCCYMASGSFQRLPFPLTTIDKTVAGSRHEKKDAKLGRRLWSPMQSFWRRSGRRQLRPDVLRFRNEMGTMEEFYGV